MIDEKGEVRFFDSDYKTPVLVWRWEDAPAFLQELSDFGGDEDWVAHVPPHMSLEYIPFFESGTSFGVCTTEKYFLADGSTVYIGAHS